MSSKPQSILSAVIQQKFQGDLERTLEITYKKLVECTEQGVQLVLLQELFNRPYFCQTESADLFDLAEAIPGPTSKQLANWSKELNLVLVTSLFEQRSKGLYHNTGVVFDHGKLLPVYRKMHIPHDPGFYEKYYFTPGDQGFVPISSSVGKLGLLICWDQWFPEAARLMALAGADILLYPTAIGWDQADSSEEQQRQYHAWQRVQLGHAVANHLPVLSCNRVGWEKAVDSDKGIHFWGGSFIAGPQGEILQMASHEEEQILVEQIDFSRTDSLRKIWPFFRDRRIDAYQGLLKLNIDSDTGESGSR